MQNDLNQLTNMPLFDHISATELEKMLPCLGAQRKTYSKGSIVLLAGAPIDCLGIVLYGRAMITREDSGGHRNMLGRVESGEVFAEVFACMGVAHSPVTVMAETDMGALFINFRRIITSCSSACAFHSRLVENMLRLFAQKTLTLNEKLGCIGHRTLREKLEAFLTVQQEHAAVNPFSIPFSRSEMADYLCVDRTALSAILSRMREEGVIKYHKNRFELLDGFYR